MLILCACAATLLLAVGAAGAPTTFLSSIDTPLPAWVSLTKGAAAGAVAVLLVVSPAVLASLVLRWRSAEGALRRQIACLSFACPVLLLGLLLDTADVRHGWLATAVAVPAGMAAAILGFQLYDLDVFISRTFVWLVMTSVVVAAYSVIIALLGDAVSSREALVAATAVIAIGFEPVRCKVQRGVDRLFFGERGDPYEVLSRLGRGLEAAVDPTVVLRALPEEIMRALHVPWAALVIGGTHGTTRIASGRQLTGHESFPLVIQGQVAGELQVGHRDTGEHFRRSECRLLHDLAAQAAAAAAASQLTRDLQRARERLVASREEERRRLRRTSDGDVEASLATLEADLHMCSGEVRRLVDELRPAALDEGLESALRLCAARLAGEGFRPGIEVRGSLLNLPAATEVAAYRIVSEAMLNAAKHAGARVCRVVLERDADLRVSVEDDGTGIPRDHQRGVGLISMAERAEELGGRVALVTSGERGTRVEAMLPLPAAPCPSPTSAQRHQGESDDMADDTAGGMAELMPRARRAGGPAPSEVG